MALIVAAMVGLAFASLAALPRLLRGDRLRRHAAARRAARRARSRARSSVRFDANIHPGLPWRFEPEQTTVTVAARRADQDLLPRAEPQRADHRPARRCTTSSPDQVGKYFKKIQCFCFTEQTLKPGQTVDMPVVFFVDPGSSKDPDTKDIDEITLSYTFYPVETGTAAR